MKTLRSLIFFLLLVLLCASCATKIKNVVITDDNPEHIWLQYAVDQNEQTIPQGFAHPAKLAPEQLQAMLKELAYEEFSFMSWHKAGPVFSDRETVRLATALSEALAQATADQWVHFAITDMKQQLLFKTRHLTDGICYIKNNRLNIVLGNMNLELINPDRDLYRADPRNKIYTDSIRLTLKPEQGITAPPIVEGDKWLGKPRRNWVQIELTTFTIAPVVEQAEPTPPPAKDNAERLRELKKLYDDGLITEEEYEQKRKDILGDI